MGESASLPAPRCTRANLTQVLVETNFQVVHEDEYRVKAVRDGAAPYDGVVRFRIRKDAMLDGDEIQRRLERAGADPGCARAAIIRCC